MECTAKGRFDVPDALLFADDAAHDRARTERDDWKRFQHGLCIVEAKRWNRVLDRFEKTTRQEDGVPSTQMLRYLRRVDGVTKGGVRWGILTNGRVWRLYWQGALAEASAVVTWGSYVSPLAARIAAVREKILSEAKIHKWPISISQLDDRHVVRRMVLKRVVYGVDKNPMAVELAKVALWLHSFTVGAPLSFLDHHLRSGDSIVGAWVQPTVAALSDRGALFNTGPISRVEQVAGLMAEIEETTDNDVVEVAASKAKFGTVAEATNPVSALFSLMTAERMLGVFDAAPRKAPDFRVLQDKSKKFLEKARADLKAFDRAAALQLILEGTFGDPVRIASGADKVAPDELVNAPVGWWYAWRKAQHGKDEALRYFTSFVEDYPVPARSAEIDIEPTIELIEQKKREQHIGNQKVIDWLRYEFEIEKPSSQLLAPHRLGRDAFVSAVRKVIPKSKKLSSALIKRLQDEHAETVEPARRAAQHVESLERNIANIVNASYGLTAEDVALMWRTAPPRMPFTETLATDPKRNFPA